MVADRVESVLESLKSGEQAAIGRLLEWLRIPSVSTDPKFGGDTRRAAEWAAVHLRGSGFEAQVLEASDDKGKPGHPMVLARSPGAPDYKGPHVLFYGHYDVQPPDPLDLWESPPFEPVVKPADGGGPGERIVARGAVDDKGQVMMFLEAMRAWYGATGMAGGGVKFTVLLEGEEESGSVSLPRFVREHAKELGACDVCLISDTGMLGRGQPAITYGVRGIAYTEVILHSANQDLHSGLWGGRCPNPNNELPKVLAQLWDKKRRVTIPGFYDRVRPLSKKERAAWKRLKFSATTALKKIGLGKAADIGEAGFTAMEREWGRPTAEVNGMIGGYTGPGAKTVIPAKASAKVSFRLVADQDPVKITKMFFAWCKKRTPPGCRWEFIDHHGGHGVTVDINSPVLAAAQRAIKHATGKQPALIKSGGSIPVAGLLKSELGLETIFMGFGLDDDRVHSPNEKFELDCYRMGARSHAMLVAELWGM
jgi:acetylornithine deacetylase/succinyl-diaminopimelate desuccinylase-like protein